MRAYRVCKSRWASTAFSGLGAAENPGRWNLAGDKAVYCAESRSLASLEILAHVSRRQTLAKARFVAFAVDVPDALIVAPSRLPRGWDAKRPSAASQKFGSRLLKQYAAVKLPSVVTRGEFILVLNSAHADFAKISWAPPEPLNFDQRIVGTLASAALGAKR